MAEVPLDTLMRLGDFVLAHTDRGECKCGKCIDVGFKPDPSGPHTVNMIFFKVAGRLIEDQETMKTTFRSLTTAHKGAYEEVNPFDGKEHGYLELGAWIGDQGIAMQYMALGVLLGQFQLLSPLTVLHLAKDDPLVVQLAGAGYLMVRVKENNECPD